jgi:hypothetical protein
VAAGVQSMPSPTSKFAAKDAIVGAEVESPIGYGSNCLAETR